MNEKSKDQDGRMADNTATPSKGWSYRGYLPHFDHNEIIQFITFRLYDSVPEKVIEQWKTELKWKNNITADSQEAFKLRERIEIYADAGHGQCFLKDKRVAHIIENALLHFDKQRYELFEWCIMPNHVHVLCKILKNYTLNKIVQSWKSFTAHQANTVLNRSGQFWMPDYFDRYIRNRHHFLKTVEYIRNNDTGNANVSLGNANFPSARDIN